MPEEAFLPSAGTFPHTSVPYRQRTYKELREHDKKACRWHYELSATMNGRSLLIRGNQTAVYRMTSDEDAADFINAVTAVKRAVAELPEWTALPPASGGCD